VNLQVNSKASRIVILSGHSSIRLLVWSYRGPLELTGNKAFEGRVIETSQLIELFYQRTQTDTIAFLVESALYSTGMPP